MELKKESKNTSSLIYTIQNIVVKADLNLNKDLDLKDISLDLEEISKKLENSKFNKNRFPGLFFRTKDPSSVIILFRNGKIILTGLKTFNLIEKVLFQLITELNLTINAHIDLKSIKSEIVNIVVTANFNTNIDLDLAAINLENIIFEPEIFPALIYKSINPVKCVFLVFNNGKIVLTGIKEKKMIEPVLKNFGRLIREKKLFIKP